MSNNRELLEQTALDTVQREGLGGLVVREPTRTKRSAVQ